MSVVSAATRSWIATSGTWSQGSNWSGGVVPTGADTAVVDNGGSVTRAQGVVDSLYVGEFNSGTLSTGGSLTAFGLGIGTHAGSSGTVNVNLGTFIVRANAWVGRYGTGTLNMDRGTVDVTNDVYLGYEEGASGTIALSQSTLHSSGGVWVGYSGNGYISSNKSLMSSGYSYIGAGGDGTVEIANESTWRNTSTLYLGQSGTGSMSISDSSQVEASRIHVAVDTEARGSLIVSGSTGRESVVKTSQIVEGDGDAQVTIDGGRLLATANQASFLSGFEAGDVILGARGARVSTDFTIGIATSLSGAGALIKEGTGILSLTGSSSHTGGTIVEGGKLIAGNVHSLGTGEVNVNSGTLSVSAGIALANPINLAGGSLEKNLSAGASLNGAVLVESRILGGIPTLAALVSGTASTAAALTASFSGSSAATNDGARRSDVFSLTGVSVLNAETGQTDLFVLELTASPADDGSFLGWRDGGVWVNAVEGNSGNNAGDTQQGYTGSFAEFQGANGTDLSNYVGAWGITEDTVWAVLNHNSEFAIVPEPHSLSLVLFGLGFLVRRKR